MGWETVLAAAALVAALVAAIGVFALLRRQSATNEADLADQVAAIDQAVQRISTQVSLGTQTQGQRTVELQQVLDGRLSRLALQSSEEATVRLQADGAARQELQTLLAGQLMQMDSKLADQQKTIATALDQQRVANAVELEKIRLEVAQKLQDSLQASLKDNAAKITELQASVASELEKVRTGNEQQLEKMRATVDEKLQGTLEKRLGESFKLVSDRLEQVQRGLGEMQTLASDVGGLKRVLTNVKTRGTWGEVQLGRQLEDILTAEQYQENVEIRPGSGERVEFAVVLPGRDEDSQVYLPIDSKFPQEPYERLLTAQETGETTDANVATKDLETALRAQSKLISSKYIDPPYSTDFAIMYLPTEGLFAEAIRIPGLAASLQRSDRVMLTGPTTLMSLLNSLQMGFRTLAIEKRSAEVWQVLAAAKEEFGKYAGVLGKIKKNLVTIQNAVDQAEVRTRAINRKLRKVESLEDSPAQDVLEGGTLEPGALEIDFQ